MERFGDEPETVRREPHTQLQPEQRYGREDRDERRSPLRTHRQRLTALKEEARRGGLPSRPHLLALLGRRDVADELLGDTVRASIDPVVVEQLLRMLLLRGVFEAEPATCVALDARVVDRRPGVGSEEP